MQKQNRSDIVHYIKMVNILYESHKERDSERMAYVSASSQSSLELNDLLKTRLPASSNL